MPLCLDVVCLTLPPIGGAELTVHLRFNKVGNREMYMNCAVVDIVKRGTKTSRQARAQQLATRDTAKANAVAQAALSSYPDLFVANLARINNCVAPETFDVVFDSPGRSITYGDNVSRSSKPSFGNGTCTGKGRTTAPTTALSVAPPPSGGASSSGDNGQWQGGGANQHQSSTSDSGSVSSNDGQWHPDLYGGSKGSRQTSSKPQQAANQPQQAATPPQQPPQADSQPSYTHADGQKPDPKVEKELNAYLASLYGGKVPSKPMVRQKRWASY
jgi:hypothetical protein